MTALTVHLRSSHLLVCFFLNLLWGASNSVETSTAHSVSTTLFPPTVTSLLTTIQPPENVGDVTVKDQNESSIMLKWDKVNNISTYFLLYELNGNLKEERVDPSPYLTYVTHVVAHLSAGRKYHFRIITEFMGANSTGFIFSAPTAPINANGFQSIQRNTSSVTLQWEKMENVNYTILFNGTEEDVAATEAQEVTHTIARLTSGTEYAFTLFTVFESVRSSGGKLTAVTAINCDNVSWHVTTSSIQGTVTGLFTNATASNGSSSHVSPQGHNVSFSGLYPGATYNVSLEYRKNSAHFLQCQLKLTTIPPDLTAHCEYWELGYSVFIVWDTPEGLWSAVEVNVSGQMHTVEGMEKRHIKIGGFQPARTYEVSLSSLSGTVRKSKPYVFQCPTDPRGVIAGSVIAVLILAALVGLAIFVLTKRKKKSLAEGDTVSAEEHKVVSLADFPNHFNKLSADKNRGFTEEYEDLAAVGIKHSQNAALVPENMEKNRFTNVLPYDWSRVKLKTTNGNSDYINASYMPGYSGSHEYIATQGPLPSTVSDFWRMIWEQSVNAIVMVTNCKEGRWTKCEHYWPEDQETRLHERLMITTASEQQDTNWTLREFRLKHKNRRKERTVTHFHFTAWPDHGVPECTDVLIQFRGLIRQHIETKGKRTPTVVHCSAGVGRTGTIIALDVVLQQLHRDNKVGINSFVHNMRLRRPHMVQTESQYVFLHRCIMDYLQSQEKTDESLYKDDNVIYVNATALQELNKMAI